MRPTFIDVLAAPDLDSAVRFLDLAYGNGAGHGLLPAELVGLRLPPALRLLYERAGRWPRLYHQNRLLLPDRLRHEGDMVVFFEENQVVWEWATRAEDAGDPPVWWRRAGEAESPWQLESASLGVFLLQTLLTEYAVGGAPVSGWSYEARPQEDLDRLLPTLLSVPPGPMLPQYDGGFRFFAATDLVLMVDPTSFVWIGAATFEAIRSLHPFVTDEWVIEGAVDPHNVENVGVEVVRAGEVVSATVMRLAVDGTLQEWVLVEPLQAASGDVIRTNSSREVKIGRDMTLTSVQTTRDGQIATLLEGSPFVRGR